MDAIRNGNFTSSEIAALLSMGSRDMTDQEKADYKVANPKGQKKTIECWPGKAAITYIEECNMERRLGRSLEGEVDAKPLSWGKLIEPRPFEMLGLEYQLISQETIQHPTIDYWYGSPDAKKGIDTVVDFKCPITLKSFCQLVDPLYLNMKEVGGVWVYDGSFVINQIRENHPQGEKYYWQIVSNAILLNAAFGELIVYVPYKGELEAIRDMASSAGELGEYTRWIYNSTDEQLPHLIEGGHYNNLNIIRFPIPLEDKQLLTQRVLQAGPLLSKRTPNLILA
jgi:hypothetical protein